LVFLILYAPFRTFPRWAGEGVNRRRLSSFQATVLLRSNAEKEPMVGLVCIDFPLAGGLDHYFSTTKKIFANFKKLFIKNLN
jgi:hypothetical protein